MRRIFFYAVAVLVLGLCGMAGAQEPTATLVGTVRDQVHAIVPGATITVRELETDEVRTATSDAQGEYTVSDLEPANYEIKISMPNFKEMDEPNLVLEAGQTARLDVSLQVGDVSEVITVTTQVGVLHTETSDKGDVISPVEISEMPLDGRDFNDLVFNVAGVAPAEEGTKGSEFVAAGARSDQSSVSVDGLNNTNPRDGTAEVTPPLDALQEFKVQTSGYSAEYGRVAGPAINLVIKKGGNTAHGDIFEFLRNDIFDAHNYFDPPGVKSELRRNQFGVSVGGPVYIPHLYNGHDKTFFWISEESFRQVKGVDAIGVVPTLQERAGNFTNSFNTYTGTPLPDNSLVYSGSGAPPVAFSNSTPCYAYNPATGTNVATGTTDKNCIPQADLNSITQQLLNFYPLPTPNFQLGGNNYIVNKKGYQNWDNLLVKLDQQLAAHDEASLRYTIRKETEKDPFPGSLTFGASSFGVWPSITHETQVILGFNETHIFNPSLINDFRSGLTRQKHAETSTDSGTNWDAALGIAIPTTSPALLQFPSIKLTGYEDLGDSEQNPVTYTSNNYDTNDTLTWNKGKHTVKFGASMLRVQYFQPTNTEFSGVISFNGRHSGPTKNSGNAMAEFEMGTPSSTDIRTGIVNNHLFDRSYAAFVQDDYKILDRLTLNLGLRYELETLPTEGNGQLSNYIPSLQEIVIASDSTLPGGLAANNTVGAPIVLASSVGLPQTLIHPNYKRFAPRLGWAWRPSLNNQTVIRGSWGIFYTGSRLTVIRTELAGQYPFSIVDDCTQSGSMIQNAFFSCAARASTANGYDPNAPSSYLESYNLTLERELPKGLALEIAYTGSKGLHIGRQIDINQKNPYNGLQRPYGFFNGIDFFNFVSPSSYNAGTVTVRKRFEKGLLFRVNYTYAKNLDVSSGLNYAGKGGYAGAQDTTNPMAEYGRADTDRRHVLNGNFVYLLPFNRNILVRGWETAGSFQMDSGTPITPQYEGPSQTDGAATRPNRNCYGNLPTGQRSPSKWFNTDQTSASACFTQPTGLPGNYFGTSRRNILDGPGLRVMNFSVSRNFRITGSGKLQFRWELFNLFNHPNFNLPNDNLDDPGDGTITVAHDPRTMQFGLKYSF